MKLKGLIVAIVSILLFNNSGSAQKQELEYSGFFDTYYFRGPWTFTLGGGVAAYNGDLCKIYNCNSFQPAYAFGLHYKLWPRVAFGGELTYFNLEGRDQNLTRNIAFTSNNFEIDAFGRFYLIDDIVRVAADRRKKPRRVKPYIQLGLGALYYNPTSFYTPQPTDSVYLQSEDKKYPGVTMVIPAAFGIGFWFSHRVSITTDINFRYTLSDYLDDVSVRGTGNGKDSYAMVMVKLQYAPWAPKLKKRKKLKGTIPAGGGGGGEPSGDPAGAQPKEEKKPETPEQDPGTEQQPEQPEQPEKPEQPEQQKEDDGWGN